MDVRERHIEQQVRFDEFKSLVHKRCRVRRDHATHVPGRMRKRLRGRDVLEQILRPTAEWSATCSENQLAHFASTTAAEALRDCGVLGINRHDLIGLRKRLHERTTHDQRFLVRKRKGGAGLQHRKGGQQSNRTGNAIEDDVSTHARELRRCIVTQEQFRFATRRRESGGNRRVGYCNHRHVELPCLRCEQFRVATVRGKPDDVEVVAVPADDVQRLRTDRPRGSEDDDAAGGGHTPSLPRSRRPATGRTELTVQ